MGGAKGGKIDKCIGVSQLLGHVPGLPPNSLRLCELLTKSSPRMGFETATKRIEPTTEPPRHTNYCKLSQALN